MKVLILGSNRHLEGDQKVVFAEACDALGAALAQQGKSFILCSQSSHTADPYVLKGAKRNSQDSGVVLYQPSVKDRVEQGVPPADAPDTKLWKDVPTKMVPGEWRLVHLKAIHDTDAVVAIGGSASGTQTAIYSAELLSKPTILIPTFGGTASENWNYFRGRYYEDSEAERLLQPWDGRADRTAKDIVETIDSISKRLARLKVSPLEQVVLGLVALISLAFWTYVMFAAPQFIPPAVALGLLLCAASISGSVLRIILRNIGALTTEWTSAHIMMSIILGLLIGFGLLLVGGFANLSLNGKIITIDTYDDARRISVSISPLLFLGSLFLEQAWGRISQRGATQLRN